MEELITLAEMGARYRRNAASLRKSVLRGSLAARKYGSVYLVTLAEAARYVAEVRMGRPATLKSDANAVQDAPKRRGRPRKAPNSG